MLIDFSSQLSNFFFGDVMDGLRGKSGSRSAHGIKLFSNPLEFLGDPSSPDELLNADERKEAEAQLRILLSDASDDAKVEAITFLTTLVESRRDAADCILESTLVFNELITFGFKKDARIRQSVLGLISKLANPNNCDTDVVDILLENPQTLLLTCKTLMKIEFGYPCRCKAMKCLYHIASHGVQYRRLMFADLKCQWSKKRSLQTVSPLTCIMAAIESEVQSETEFREALETEEMTLSTDESAEHFRVSCIRFLGALIELGKIPENKMLQEIIEHIISVAVDSRNPSCVVWAVHGTAVAARRYYHYFYSSFRNKAALAHYKWLLGQTDKEICNWVLETFIVMANQCKEEAQYLFDQHVLDDIHPANLDDDGIANACRLCGALVSQLGTDVDFANTPLIHIIEHTISNGSYVQKFEAMKAFAELLEVLPVTDVQCILTTYSGIIPDLFQLVHSLDDPNGLETYLRLAEVIFSALESEGRAEDIRELVRDAELWPVLEQLCCDRNMNVAVKAKQLRAKIAPHCEESC